MNPHPTDERYVYYSESLNEIFISWSSYLEQIYGEYNFVLLGEL